MWRDVWVWGFVGLVGLSCDDREDRASKPNLDAAGSPAVANVAGAPGAAGGSAVDDAGASSAGGVAPDEVPPLHVSGTRLRAITMAASDGMSQWIGWHDTELDSDCAFQEADDGALRCLPGRQAPSYGLFADDDCAQPIFYVYDDCTPPRFMLSAKQGECGAFHVFEMGDKVTSSTGYRREEGECVPVALDETVLDSEYYRATPVAAASLVRAERFDDARGNELGLGYLKADDGALQSLEAIDLARKADCRGEQKRCVPSRAAGWGQHGAASDPACSTTLAQVDQCSQDPTALSRTQVSNECGVASRRDYFEVGAEYPSDSPVYCQGDTEGRTPRYFTVGAPIDFETFPAISQVDVGEGRLKARYDATPDGVPLKFLTFFDTELDVPCLPTLSFDAGIRCMPGYQNASGYFADAECSEPALAIAQRAGVCPGTIEGEYFQGMEADACLGFTPQLSQAGAKLSSSTAFQRVGDECTMLAGFDVYPLVPVPLTDLVEMSRVIE